MLPRKLLTYGVREDLLVPHYLTASDQRWIHVLMDELGALVGHTADEVEAVLAPKVVQLAREHEVPLTAVKAVRFLLQKAWPTRIRAAVPPHEIRRVVFELGADESTLHDEVLNRAAAALGIRVEEVTEGMFADRPSERRLAAPAEEPAPSSIIATHNLALAQGILLRSERVVAHVRAHVRSVVSFAKMKGLLCSYSIDEHGTKLTLSGPLALFRHTLKYGFALASFFPAVAATPDWSIEARCRLGNEPVRFRANASDPVGASFVSRNTESPLEKHLLRDFRNLDSSWTLRRESSAVEAGASTFFPDFTLERGPNRVYVEIVGYYTPEYVASKLEALRKARLPNVIVCIDESLACADGEITADAIIRFHKRIDAAVLLQAAERSIT